VTEATHAVFLSYASEDAPAAHRIAEALRLAGIEVWFDREELRGGDAWDQKIRQQIRDCRLFLPIISVNSEARLEGYFRREWKLAVDRTDDMASEVSFLVPVVIDDTPNASAHVPERFRHVQWTRLPGGKPSAPFTERVRQLLLPEPLRAPTTPSRVAKPFSTALPIPPKPVIPPWRSKRSLVAMVTGLVVIALGYLTWQWLFRPRAETPAAVAASTTATQAATPKDAIAVLPFTDLSEKGDQAFFAEGMAEELAGLLAKIPSLRVLGTTSSFRFKDGTVDVRSIANQLGASYLVQGSVRRSGDRIRVAAKLLDGRNGEQRWSDTYDRDVSDALKVQEEIATSLARTLRLTVGAHLGTRTHAKSPEAYDLYLKGVRAYDLGSHAATEEATADLQQALSLDPAYAPAAAELGKAYVLIAIEDWQPHRVALERARQAAEAALQLDPKLSAAHAVMANIHLVYDWDWPAAKKEVLEAQRSGDEEDPVSAEVASALAANAGEWDQAIRLNQGAIARDPLNADLYVALAYQVYLRSGRYAEAEAAMRRALQISPEYASGWYFLGVALMLQGRLDEALQAMQRETIEDGQLEGSALVFHAVGRKAESDAALKRATELHAETWTSEIARVHAFRGELDQAMGWLERAYSVRDTDLCFIKNDPLLKKLEDDPRYKAFLRKMNLPE
jgi:TolB-like protein/Tfp pilus assembly protein PilF